MKVRPLVLLLVLGTLTNVLGLEEGLDYPGYDIKRYSRADLTMAECKKDCIQTAQCTRWLFIEKMTGWHVDSWRNFCFLKDKGATFDKGVPYAGRGKAFSAPVLLNQVIDEEEQGWHYNGNDIRHFSLASKENCREVCAADLRCKVWVFHSGEEYEGNDYPGHDIKYYSSANLTKFDCKQDCLQTAQCARWLFIEGMTEGRNYCWIKNSGATTSVPYEGTGKAFSETASGESEGYDFPGNDFKHFNRPDLTKAECKQDCIETHCARWLFLEDITEGKNFCWLKGSGPGLHTRVEMRFTGEGKVFSASGTCFLKHKAGQRTEFKGEGKLSAGLMYEEEVGWDYYGSDIKPGRETRTNPNQPIAEAKAECIMDCLQTEGCKVWEFIENIKNNTNACFVKSKGAYLRRAEYNGQGTVFAGSVGNPRFATTRCISKQRTEVGDWNESQDSCCNGDNRCGLAEGDCDTDGDCQEGLICGTNNCPANKGFLREDDCCHVKGIFYKVECRINEIRSYSLCCKEDNKCGVGAGECKGDNTCQPGLKCRTASCYHHGSIAGRNGNGRRQNCCYP